MPTDATLLETMLALYTTAQVALVGAVIYLHVRFARVESALSHPEFGLGVILKDLVKRVGDLESARRR